MKPILKKTAWKKLSQKKKRFLKKLKENVDDHEEQMAILGAAVRLGVVVWSGFIITLNYVELPMVKKSVHPLISRSWLRFLQAHSRLSGCPRVMVRKMETVTELQQNQKHEEMDSSLSSVVTRSSESKYNYSSVHTREYELNDNNYPNNFGDNNPRSIWSRGKNLVWNKCHCIWRHLRFSNNMEFDNFPEQTFS